MATATKSPGKAIRKLDHLQQQVAKANVRLRELDLAQSHAKAKVEQLSEALASRDDLPVDGSPPARDSAVRKLWEERAVAKATLDGPWEARRARARRGITKAESEVEAYSRDHLGELMAEHEPEARAAPERVISKLEEALAAIDDWYGVSGRTSVLLRGAPGIDGSDVPSPGHLQEVASVIRRAVAVGVPAPLPRSLYPPADPTITTAKGGGLV